MKELTWQFHRSRFWRVVFTAILALGLAGCGNEEIFKMVGDAKTVAREKDAFVKFVQSVKLPNAA